MEDLAQMIVVAAVFVGVPWLIMHYITKWKSQGSLTSEDEKLMDELHEMARRLDERVATIERIMTAENPGWRQIAADPVSLGTEDNSLARRMANERP
ncbi:MAG: envelope stress response membrane protein PspB [Pseudomonadota bacterium]|nr:envelope stress response membrane protein PspB [Pseudomonadota bacterium]